ncbi:unnamed protein product [Gongylonema pulchrum]|uniref:Protein tweety homolog n=1 Tax=Gongylonema pulchrum TaxID=637853 RepID=A0A183E4N2_9BILA|nr:unnamed protein product [Gongylonema pulchrum]
MAAYRLLIDVLHRVPRFTFTLQPASNTFSLQYNSQYMQRANRTAVKKIFFFEFKALLLFVAVILLLGATLLLTIVITWICQCCSKQSASVKSRRRVRQLSLVLFIISVICFLCLGICLFGNEHLNRSITNSVIAADDISRNLLFAESQCNSLNKTRINSMKLVDTLSTAVENAVERTTGINKTALHELETMLDSLSQKIDLLGSSLAVIKSPLSKNSFIEQSTLYTQRIELERWVLCATLLSIMLVVLFAGVIGFCRQSKKGAVIFSGLGFAIFIVGWLLLAIILPACMALADFCAGGTQFIRQHLPNETMDLFEFYRKCDPVPSHSNVPADLQMDKLSRQLSDIQAIEQQKLVAQIGVLFNHSQEADEVSFSAAAGVDPKYPDNFQLSEQVHLINNDLTHSLKTVGALETTLACYTYHNDVVVMERGFCQDGIIGASILLYCLILLEIFLFALLLIVSKSWHLFARLPSDYVEVDEEDPFFPRGNDSNIPVDIYGSHVLNPRTRFVNSLYVASIVF